MFNKLHKYTVLVVPDHGGSVFSFRAIRIFLWMIPVFILSLIGAIYFLYEMANVHLNQANILQEQLSLKEGELQYTVIHKNKDIANLNHEIEVLTTQAEQIQVKLAELQQLEVELRDLVNNEIHPVEGQESNRLIISSLDIVKIAEVTESTLDLQALGGPYYPIDDDNPESLSTFIGELTYQGLNQQVVTLISSLSEVKDEITSYLEIMRVTPSIYPTDSHRITSQFGTRRDPFTGVWSYHSGVDIGASFNSEVYATADGVVSTVGSDQGKGNYVTINHGNGLQTRYMHLNKYIVKAKQAVEKGDVIGYVGSTGRSTGPHLHYEVIKNGKQVDPIPYLNTSGK